MSLNKTKIEWANYTWNPVVGCKKYCSYCYAKRMNDRFKWISNWNEPQFFPERLNENFEKLKPDSKIFVGSMCDLFGDWIPSEWIRQILYLCSYYDHLQFMFLTQNPKRYNEFQFAKNHWVGMTLVKENIPSLVRLKCFSGYTTCARKFVSIEPIIGTFKDFNFSQIDLVIIGAMTSPGAIKPQKAWIESIKHDNIFYKNNIKMYK